MAMATGTPRNKKKENRKPLQLLATLLHFFSLPPVQEGKSERTRPSPHPSGPPSATSALAVRRGLRPWPSPPPSAPAVRHNYGPQRCIMEEERRS
uniref:Uncharacterized protein n=1 Tax=Leersia perrieri TaxID=77586 RepID=A0A0D9WQG4_9ORYZ